MSDPYWSQFHMVSYPLQAKDCSHVYGSCGGLGRRYAKLTESQTHNQHISILLLSQRQSKFQHHTRFKEWEIDSPHAEKNIIGIVQMEGRKTVLIFCNLSYYLFAYFSFSTNYYSILMRSLLQLFQISSRSQQVFYIGNNISIKQIIEKNLIIKIIAFTLDLFYNFRI